MANKGGSYVLRDNGARELKERTLRKPEKKAEKPVIEKSEKTSKGAQ